MGNKIKPFREWKKWKKRKLLAKGIDVSGIGEKEWRRRYKSAKTSSKAKTIYWSDPKNKKIQGDRMRKRYEEGNHPIQTPENLKKMKLGSSKRMRKLAKMGKCPLQNPNIRKKAFETQRKRNYDWTRLPHPWCKGKKNCMHKPEVKTKVNTRQKSIKLRKATIERCKRGDFKLTPNKSELFLLEILNQIYPNQWKYTGDGKFWINDRNPDFIHKKEKKVIELFGDYWHNLKDGRPTKIQRINNYKKADYDCLVIWHKKDRLWSHPENVANKIIDWNKN